MNHKNRPFYRLFFIFIFTAGCILQQTALADLPRFMLLIDEPQNETFATVYPEIEDLYESDSQLTLLAVIEGPPKGKYPVHAQIQNVNGKIVFDEQKEMEIKPPYLRFVIALDDDLKSKLVPGSMWLRLFVDGKPYKDKRIQYNRQSLVNKNISKAVVLPFFSSTDLFFEAALKEKILSTFSDIIRVEMQRTVPEVVSSAASGPKVTHLKIKKCLDRKPCRNELKKIYTEGLFITGDVSIPKIDSSAQGLEKEAFLTLFLYNSRTDEKFEFRSSLLMRPTDKEKEIMKKLVNNVLTGKGFLFHVRSLM